MTPAERDVLAEREKQRQRWGDDHDDDHGDGEIGFAAAEMMHPIEPREFAVGWAERLRARTRGDRRRQLVIAAALAIAEIDRLDRGTP